MEVTEVMDHMEVTEVMEVDGNFIFMKDVKELDWLEIFLWYKCNVNCEFCFQKYIRSNYKENFSKKEIFKIIDEWHNKWKKFIIFSWWEPTLDSNLPLYIDYSKKKWYLYIRVHSNGFMFNNFDYLQDLHKRWLNWLTFSIHWYWEDHDKITWNKWSFNRLKLSLQNSEKIIQNNKNFIVDVNTVIYKWNYNKLFKLFVYLFRFSIKRFQINYSSSLDMFSLKEKKKLLVPYKDIVKEIQRILILSLKKNKKLVIDSIPYCIIWKKFWFALDNNIKNDRESISRNWDNEKTYDETYNNVKTNRCFWCKKYNICRWITQDYYEVFWDNELIPILW